MKFSYSMRFFLLLSATCACGNSAATMQKVDLVMRLKNASDHTFEICSPWMTSCRRVLPGALLIDGMITEGHEKEYAAEWLGHYIAKGCGHLIHLRHLVDKRTDERTDRNSTILHIVVSQKSVEAACRIAEEAKPPGSFDAVVKIP